MKVGKPLFQDIEHIYNELQQISYSLETSLDSAQGRGFGNLISELQAVNNACASIAELKRWLEVEDKDWERYKREVLDATRPAPEHMPEASGAHLGA